MKKTCTLMSIAAMLILFCTSTWAQSHSPLETAMQYLNEKQEEWQLTRADLADIVVSDMYQSRHNGATHIYFNQRHAGIELYNAINGVHLKENGEVVFATNRFTPNLAEKTNTTEPGISALEAVYRAADYLNQPVLSTLRLLEQVGDRQFTYAGGSISNSDIKVKLVYQLMEDNSARLAWDLSIDESTSVDYWSLRLDALTGEVLDQHNWTISCNFGTHAAHSHQHNDNCAVSSYENGQSMSLEQAQAEEQQMLNDNAQYRVWAVPAESPSHGDRELVVNPAHPVASPYGWHDVNGEEGAEYRITRGNNVHAFLDLDNDDTPNGDEPNGGEELIFDFPVDLNQEPSTYREMATTQLFYMNNFLHDFTYRYGLDEASGNFQENNYGNGGQGGDYVLAQAQDGGGTNNANFATPPDGGNGRMQMYLWTGGGSVFSVNSPQPVAGGYLVGQAAFGGSITTIAVTGDIVVVDDGSGQGSLGCGDLINTDQLEGAIALIDRGSCEFGRKALNAEEAGAIGAIICNFEDEIPGLGAGEVGGFVTIPVLAMGLTDCQTIREFAGNGLNATIQLPEDNGPEFIDGDLDNGIIAHEYGHGISNRLTGGPSASGCLSNGEQAGEGWSDYFGLVTSVRPGDTGDMGRGIGTFAQRQDPTGPGIRRQRYSTDMSINNQTYIDIAGQGVHATGEVWAAVTWDLYWAMTELYGWDEDPIDGEGGNNMAIQLVMDGMKLQACNPGFMDGRDAILAADELNYDGIHECLIWEVFARRGIGFFSDQGSNASNSDGEQDFEPRPQCIAELKIRKSVTDLVSAGEEIEVTLTITNHKGEGVTEVVVEDELPAGLTFVNGSESSNVTANVDGNVVSLEVGDMANDETITVTYRLATDAGLFSIRQFFDGFEDGDDDWFFDAIEGFSAWTLLDQNAYEGDNCYFVANEAAENDQTVFLEDPLLISGTNPVMRFYHNFSTEIGDDGGFVEVSTDGGFIWDKVDQSMIRNGYNAIMTYGTLAIPNLGIFSGNSGGYIATYIDMSDYAGQEVNIRFRFGSDVDFIGSGSTPGWYIDNIEIMDLFNYNNETCVMSAEGDMACATAPQSGTIVESMVVSNLESEVAESGFQVFPNPANDLLNIAIKTPAKGDALLTLVGMDGRVIMSQQLELDGHAQLFPLNVSRLQAGMYYVKIQAGNASFAEKVVIR